MSDLYFPVELPDWRTERERNLESLLGLLAGKGGGCRLTAPVLANGKRPWQSKAMMAELEKDKGA